MFKDAVIGSALCAPSFIEPPLATLVAAHEFPVELIVQVEASVLETVPFGRLIVPFTTPVLPPRRPQRRLRTAEFTGR